MRMKTWMRDMTTNLMLTMITNTLVSVFIFAIFAVFCDADRQETTSDVNVAGMVLIPADGMPQWLMRIGLASGYRQKPSGRNPHVAVSSAHLKPSTLQTQIMADISMIRHLSGRTRQTGPGSTICLAMSGNGVLMNMMQTSMRTLQGSTLSPWRY